MRLFAAALCAGTAALANAGCDGHTTSAATPERVYGTPPTIVARFASGDPLGGELLANPVWNQARWVALSAPANTSRTTAPSRVAVLLGEGMLYLGIVNLLQPEYGTAETRNDAVSLFLDTTGTDRELFQVTLDRAGVVKCSWHRSSAAARPLEDGSPNLGHPVTVYPDVPVPGLRSRVDDGHEGERAVWTAVLAVPMRGLPARLWSNPGHEVQWKFNVLRTVTAVNATGQLEQLQANLSPVYVNAQSVSPYRLAELDVAEQP